MAVILRGFWFGDVASQPPFSRQAILPSVGEGLGPGASLSSTENSDSEKLLPRPGVPARNPDEDGFLVDPDEDGFLVAGTAVDARGRGTGSPSLTNSSESSSLVGRGVLCLPLGNLDPES